MRWVVNVFNCYGETGRLRGIALGSQACIEAIWQSLPARGAVWGMTAAALNCAAEHPELLARLRRIIAYMKGKMNAMGIPVGDTESPNVTFSIGTPEDMQRIQQALLAGNIYIMYSKYIGAPLVVCCVYPFLRITPRKISIAFWMPCSATCPKRALARRCRDGIMALE